MTLPAVAVMSIAMSSCARRARGSARQLAARARAAATPRRQGVDAGVAHRDAHADQLSAGRRAGLRAGDRRRAGDDRVGVRGSGVTSKRIGPEPLTDQELAWCRHLGADLRVAFEHPRTSDRDRKLLIRAIITEIQLTFDREQAARPATDRVGRGPAHRARVRGPPRWQSHAHRRGHARARPAPRHRSPRP